MVRLGFLALGAVALLGFFLSGALQTAAELRYPNVQWVVDGRPNGPVERAGIEGLPRLKGTGPDGSVFVDRRYRNRALPFGIEARAYSLARLGSVAAFLTSVLGFFTHRSLERQLRISRGETPV